MTRILITGMSGTGKSTLLGELARRGHLTVDTDDDGWTLVDGRWDEPRMDAFLRSRADVVVSGTVENQGRFYPLFAGWCCSARRCPVRSRRRPGG